MKNATRPAIFKWRQTAPELILCAARWYLRYSLSLRDVEELFAERGLEAAIPCHCFEQSSTSGERGADQWAFNAASPGCEESLTPAGGVPA